jgi:hypothetical protein
MASVCSVPVCCALRQRSLLFTLSRFPHPCRIAVTTLFSSLRIPCKRLAVRLVMLLPLYADHIDVGIEKTLFVVPKLRLVTTMNSSLFPRQERRRLLLHDLYWKILSKKYVLPKYVANKLNDPSVLSCQSNEQHK